MRYALANICRFANDKRYTLTEIEQCEDLQDEDVAFLRYGFGKLVRGRWVDTR